MHLPASSPTPRTVPRSPATPRVTAAMVAARAGVSAATVSLVTSGKTAGRVSAGNIAKVESSIAELGYIVDGLGSSLAKGRSDIVILVAPDVSNPFYADVIAGVRAAIAKDFQLLLSVTDAGQTPDPSDVRRLLALRPAGMLVDAPSAHFLDELRVSDPMVLLDAVGVDSDAPSVNFDVAQGARLLAEHLAGLGHRKVAYLDSSTGTETFQVRREAFGMAAAKLGLKVVANASVTIDVGKAAQVFAQEWEGWSRKGITAVVCATDTHAYGVLQEARVAGICIPQELAVTGFDDLPYSESTNPPLTSVHLPAFDMGRLAGEKLLALIVGAELTPTQLTLEATLVVRGSTCLVEKM